MAIFVTAAALAAFVWIQAAVYRRLWDKNLTLSVSLSARAVFEGETVRIYKELRNAKLLPLPFVLLCFNAYGFAAETDGQARYVSAFSLPAFRKARIEHAYVCAKRGYYKLRDFHVDSCNLMMADWQCRQFGVDDTLVVYPKVIRAEEPDIPYQRIFGDVTAKRFLLDDPFSFNGIREYQPYDSFRAVNFQASAKTGILMSNTYDSSFAQEVLIVLNVQDHTTVSVHDVSENAIRLAAFLAGYYIGKGVSVGLLSGGVDTVTGQHTHLPSGGLHEYAVYEALARIDLQKRPRPAADILDGFPVPDGCSVILISRYQGQDLRDWFEAVKRETGSAMWVVPFLSGEGGTVAGDGIYAWEAEGL